jgi:hypothetical protein
MAGDGHIAQPYYLRRAKARHEATSQAIYRNSEIALRDSAAQTRAVFERLEWQLAELRADLARAAEAQVVMAAIIGELAHGRSALRDVT